MTMIRAVAAAALLLLGAALVHRVTVPPRTVAATAPDSAFSAMRAMRHVRAIAQRPRPAGSVEHARVRAYLVQELRALGLAPEVQETVAVGTRYRATGMVHNVVARLPGTRSDGPAVLLVAHYDSREETPGAGDDAAGVATLLETARALHAGPPLAHDVLLLFTDREEHGLLGAAAFVREHPAAHDAAAILNFEARGTGGRAFMFETGPGNHATVEVLRRVRDVSASSLMVLAYRVLPNDTDLSELSALGVPAMNFAFIDGVGRYHTALDDVAHLDPRSVQHMGTQALALTRLLGAGALPLRPSADAVFFDVPALGLIVYPAIMALPLALLAAALAVGVVVRGRHMAGWWRGVARGAGSAVAAVMLAPLLAGGFAVLILALHGRAGWGGAPAWRESYHVATTTLALACTMTAWALVRRAASREAAFAGTLAVWGCVTVAVTVFAPGASYLVTWPLLATAGATLALGLRGRPHAGAIAHGAAAAITLTFLLPVIVLLGTALGTTMIGAAAAGLLTALTGLLLAPSLEWLAGSRRWRLPVAAIAVSFAAVSYGAATAGPRRAVQVRGGADAAASRSALPRPDSAAP